LKAHYRTANGRITFEIEGGNQKELFEGVANLQEIFEADSTCGLCHKPNLKFRVREVQNNKYYELHCADCGAQFQFGQHKTKPTLFPKRKDKDDKWLPNRGWSKYQPTKEEDFQ
jgi:hypothetical protein